MLILLHQEAYSVRLYDSEEEPRELSMHSEVPLSKDGVENNAIPMPQEAPQCQPQTFILITSVAWTTESQQSNQLTAGGEGLHPYACQLREWIKASRGDSPGRPWATARTRCTLKEGGDWRPALSLSYLGATCSSSALKHVGLSSRGAAWSICTIYLLKPPL